MTKENKKKRLGGKMPVAVKILVIIISIIVVLITEMIIYMTVTGKGKIKQFDNDNSVAERTFIDVNGTENGMIIRGKDINNPVLLFISGGPGVPQYWMNEYYDNDIEDHFTVCWWDYAGEGLSYDSKLEKDDITMERLQNDAVTIVNYLKDRFGVDKVYLMAHSGGSPLGISLASKHPELFYAYFGMGQIVSSNRFGNRYESAYYFMKDVFLKNNDEKNLKKMNKLLNIDEDGKVTPKNIKNLGAKWEGILLAAGCATTRDMRSDAREIFLPQISSKCYTLKEKINFWKGKFFCSDSKYDHEFTDEGYLDTLSDEYEIPIYFISGYYDYTCPVILVEKYYDAINAPDKKMMIYNDSAHSPLLEENDKVLEFMESVIER